MNIFDLNNKYNEYKKRFDIISSKFDGLSARNGELEDLQQNPDFYADSSLFAKVNKEKRSIEKKLDNLKRCKTALEDFGAGIELFSADTTSVSEQELEELENNLEKILNTLWIETLLNKECDDGPAIITLHPGAGGEEAQDWAEMLARMYLRYAEMSGFKTKVLDYQAGDGAGVKTMSILVEGEYAYGYLRTERGVHRLVRISPFDAQSRRHTSFASVEVSPFVEDSQDIEILDKDLKFDTYKSCGAGGQHVNKTESAVRITHLPTGIVVQCQNERSQIKNKEMAMKMLYSKLLERDMAKKEQEKQARLGENKKIEWGSQIRSYILQPYNLVKDHRTNLEDSNTTAVLDGNIQDFINAFLKVDI